MRGIIETVELRGGYEKGVDILQGIDLTVREREAVGIIGLNGSGKSTLGRAIMNLLPYRSGSILFDGQSVDTKTTYELAQMGIALMHQGGKVFPGLSVWQNLQMASPEFDPQLKEIIPLLQRPKKELMHTMADKLSGGQRHELALAMTFARNPRMVILDEPSAGLSPVAVEEAFVMLQRLRERWGITIILIEQNISRAVSFCDRCLMLGQGKIEHVFSRGDMTLSEIESIMFN